MKKIILGSQGFENSAIEVTEMCFGALPIGPLQKNIPVDEASDIISYALQKGINFIDTAHVYQTYPHIRRAMEKSGIRPVIASKSPAMDYEGMAGHIETALSELGLDYIDIFLIHAARADRNVFEDRSGALKCLIDYKQKGVVRAVGISTHDVSVVDVAADNDNIDIVYPIINKTGMGILGGGRPEMEQAIKKCLDKGKGVYFMKVLAGGNLTSDYISAMDYARDLADDRAAISVGMVSKQEVDINIAYFNGEDVSKFTEGDNAVKKRFFIPKMLCKACGECLKACHSGAIEIVDDVAVIDNDKCLTCGYCVNSCPQFAIRMI